MHRTEFVVRRFGQAVMTVAIVVTISFTLVKLLPGSAWVLHCIGQGAATGQCQDPPAEVTSTVPPGELLVMGLFILVLFLIAGAIAAD